MKYRVIKPFLEFKEGEVFDSEKALISALTYQWKVGPIELILLESQGFIEQGDKPWVPKEGEKYWFVEICDKDMTCTSILDKSERDARRMHSGNYFPTESEAQAAALKIKELLLSLKK